MAVIESQVVALELEKVKTKVETVFEREDMFYSHIVKRGDVEKVSNRAMRIPLELRPGGKFQYWNPDGGDLGRGGGPRWDKAVVNCVFVSENIEYTKLVEYSTNSDRKAVQNGVRRLVATALEELRRQLDSQLQGDGSGQIGEITVVATAAGVDTYTLDNTDYGARLVRFDQVVQVYDAAKTTFRGKGVITNWDVANNSIDVTPAVAGAIATDVLIVDGLSSPTSLPAILGVKYHHSNASTGTWLGFSRSTTPEIRSNRVNGNAAALSLPLPRLARYRMRNRIGRKAGAKVKAWMHSAQAQAYENIGQAVIMINKSGKQEKLDMYFDMDDFQLAGAPARVDDNWDKSRIDFVDEAIWGRAEILPIGFYKSDGRNIFEIRGASGGVAAAEIFYMVWGGQFFVTNPAATAYIDNLAIPADY